MSSLLLISCVKKKHKGVHPAQDIYCSDWFTKAKRLSHNFDNWLILSALYGVVKPDELIKDYNMTLNSFTKKQKQLWSIKVYKELKNHLADVKSITFFAGINYRLYLEHWLVKDGFKVNTPMKGLAIGKQLRWLSVYNNKKI